MDQKSSESTESTRKSSRSNSGQAAVWSEANNEKYLQKKGKTCKICGLHFGPFVLVQKFECEYCKETVCAKCSNSQPSSSGPQHTVRVCNNCYTESIKIDVASKHHIEAQEFQKILNEIKESYDRAKKETQEEIELKRQAKHKLENIDSIMEDEEKQLVRDIEIYKDENFKLEAELKEKSLKINDIENAAKDKEKRILEIKIEIKEIEEAKSKDSGKAEQLKIAIREQVLENKKLEEDAIIAEVAYKNLQEAIINAKAIDENKYNQRMSKIRTQIENIKRQNTKLGKKIDDMKEERVLRDSTISVLSQSFIATKDDDFGKSFMNTELGIKYKPLKEQYRSQIEEICQLRSQLSGVRSLDRTEFSAGDYTEKNDPMTRNPCKCLIQ
ncbi:unnamed protein product [Blepharisma stoltei]|uniref:FYVE-type domain-containing protein n=1 Tax=Blepharisma stoltei TaxID=1481888 RepID=A0AAU9J9X7_9CILI|nr:unnamed protein product [Blepharisma stoltei]